MPERTCSIEGCDRTARSSSADWCKMHYHRWYRHGSTDKVVHDAAVTVSLGRRYRTKYRPDHPLAGKNGNLYEHRMVLFEAIGYGPHRCHWCGTEVDWLPKGDPRELQPDHLNNDGADNRLENIVASCRRCNTVRAVQRRADALREAGWWSRNDTIASLSKGGRASRVDAA